MEPRIHAPNDKRKLLFCLSFHRKCVRNIHSFQEKRLLIQRLLEQFCSSEYFREQEASSWNSLDSPYDIVQIPIRVPPIHHRAGDERASDSSKASADAVDIVLAAVAAVITDSVFATDLKLKMGRLCGVPVPHCFWRQFLQGSAKTNLNPH